MSRFTLAPRTADEFGVVSGSGWVVLENGKRIDWPMLTSKEEALADLADFRRSIRELEKEEAMERSWFWAPHN